MKEGTNLRDEDRIDVLLELITQREQDSIEQSAAIYEGNQYGG